MVLGIINSHNNCYQNVIYQLLSCCSEFIQESNQIIQLNKEYFNNNDNDLAFPIHLKEYWTKCIYLLYIIQKNKNISAAVNINTLIHLLRFKFEVNIQYDCHEFLLFLFEIFEKISYPLTYQSRIKTIFCQHFPAITHQNYSLSHHFFGIIYKTIDWNVQNEVITRYTYSYSLQLSIPTFNNNNHNNHPIKQNEWHLIELLKYHNQTELIEFESPKFHTNMQYQRNTLIIHWPQYLCIEMKKSISQLTTQTIHLPYILPIGEKVQKKFEIIHRYRLIAVICYFSMFQIAAGHYFIYIYNKMVNKWYLINDQSIQEVVNLTNNSNSLLNFHIPYLNNIHSCMYEKM